jgi:hypothetical protein
MTNGLFEINGKQLDAKLVTQAVIDIEVASWSRSWTRLVAARMRLEKLTGINISGRFRRELEAARELAEGAPHVNVRGTGTSGD